MNKDQTTPNCPSCGQTDPNYLSGSYCWNEEACHQRTYPPDWAASDDERMCFTTDAEEMYVALRKIMKITGHDHSNPIFEICIEAMPAPRK